MEGCNERKKGGRPKKAVIRKRTTGIRFSAIEYMIVRAKARKAGVRITTYIRQTVVDGEVKTRLTDEEKLFMRQLIGISNNINQVARLCHEQGVLRALLYFDQFKDQIDQLLEKLKV